VLLAIKPVHLANIITQQKNHEYRKYRLKDGVTRLWLYETSEGGAGRSSITYVSSLLSIARFCLELCSLLPPVFLHSAHICAMLTYSCILDTSLSSHRQYDARLARCQ
jgi:hypothetical protein